MESKKSKSKCGCTAKQKKKMPGLCMHRAKKCRGAGKWPAPGENG